MAEQGGSAPRAPPVTYIIEMHADIVDPNADPGYDKRVVEKMISILKDLAKDFSKLSHPEPSTELDQMVQQMEETMKYMENPTQMMIHFFETVSRQPVHRYDPLTLGGALMMTLRCMQDNTYIYNPAEFAAEAIYIMAFRNREDDRPTFLAMESTLPKILNRNIRDLLMNLYKIKSSVPEALEARFYFETPFDVDIDHLQDLCADASVAPTMDAERYLGRQKTTSRSGLGDCRPPSEAVGRKRMEPNCLKIRSQGITNTNNSSSQMPQIDRLLESLSPYVDAAANALRPASPRPASANPNSSRF